MHHIVGLIGDPVAHSRSPAMHNAAFTHLGIDAHYETWRTPAAELSARVQALRDPAYLGANITLPHKTAVIPLLDELEPEAAQIGAVNTIFKRADGALVGANTDAPALLDALREEGDFTPAGQSVMVLGASGAARAAVYALINADAAQLIVVNRTLERAEELLVDVIETLTDYHDAPFDDRTLPRLTALALDGPDVGDTLAACSLLINATSLGWHNDETPLPDPPIAPGALVYDMVYRPTRLLHDASARGARTLDGLGMLIRQGALAFTRWVGHSAPLDVMRAALKDA